MQPISINIGYLDKRSSRLQLNKYSAATSPRHSHTHADTLQHYIGGAKQSRSYALFENQMDNFQQAHHKCYTHTSHARILKWNLSLEAQHMASAMGGSAASLLFQNHTVV